MKKIFLIIMAFMLSACGTIKSSSNRTLNWFIQLFNKNYKEDNAAEEFIEDRIEDISGIEMDLSPASPEEEEEKDESNL